MNKQWQDAIAPKRLTITELMHQSGLTKYLDLTDTHETPYLGYGTYHQANPSKVIAQAALQLVNAINTKSDRVKNNDLLLSNGEMDPLNLAKRSLEAAIYEGCKSQDETFCLPNNGSRIKLKETEFLTQMRQDIMNFETAARNYVTSLSTIQAPKRTATTHQFR